MMFRLCTLFVVFAVSACAGKPMPALTDAEYWQRIGTMDNAYVQGPKAQQMLHRDIAHCVAEGRELVRLGAIRDVPHYRDRRVRDKDTYELNKWDTPERDRYMFTEHGNYHDFEGCMQAAGWQRVKYIPFDKVDEYDRNYYKAHVDYKHRSRKIENRQQDTRYMDLNE
jgi:nitrous oxide reductase accessory protein NosL